MHLEVVYIAGWMRSGTTLLCQKVGELDNSIAVGELSGIWLALQKDHPCSCGQLLSQCPLWSRVIADMSVQIPGLDYSEMATLARRVLRTRDSLKLLGLRRRPRDEWPEDILRYVEAMEQLYASVARHSGCQRIVDSSKLPPTFLLQRVMPNVESKVLHITRDPRAVASSEKRTLIRSGPNPELTPPGKKALKSALLWAGANLSVAMLASRTGEVLHVEYEDLTTDEGSLESIAAWLNADSDPRGGSISHIAVGNPSRMAGFKAVVRDDRWREELDSRDRVTVSAVTWPARMILRRVYRS